MRIYVQVPQQMSAGIRSGLTADLRLPQYPDKTFKAEVATTSSAINLNARTLLVELRGKSGRPAAARRLRAGRFRAAEQSRRGVHPTSALVFREGALKSRSSGRATASSSSRSRSANLGTEVEVLPDWRSPNGW